LLIITHKKNELRYHIFIFGICSSKGVNEP